jgi:hypothetical protein
MDKFPELTEIEYCLYLMSYSDLRRFEYFLSYYLQKTSLINHYFPHIPEELKGFSDHGYKHVKNILQLQQKILISNVPFLENLIYKDEDDEIPENSALNFYELYLLLSATLWHDVGNLIERFHHNEHIPAVENDIHPYFIDKDIKAYVLQIAKAHTGADGVRIQIPLPISCYCNEQISCQFIGALLRFTDELDEGQNRLDMSYYERLGGKIEKHQKIFWEVCNCIKRINPNPKSFNIEIDANIEKKDIWTKYPKLLNEGKSNECEIEVCVIDELIYRVNKMNIERMNYMGYVQKLLEFKNISLNLNIIDGANSKTDKIIFSDQFGYNEFWQLIIQ